MKAGFFKSVRSHLMLFVLLLAIFFLAVPPDTGAYAFSEGWNPSATTLLQDDQPSAHPAMQITPDIKAQWSELHRRAPFAGRDAQVDKRLAGRTVGTSISVLPNIQYNNPSQRNQGSCGDCWVWAGTGVLEAALDAQLGIKDRLSIQYFESNYNNGAAGSFACCGGTVPGFVNYYASTLKKAVPWSNTNAAFVDSSRSCSSGATMPASSIVTSPSYAINSISYQQIQTYGVTDATAVANIKNILNQGQAVVFCFYLTSSDWPAFTNWWNSSSESAIWSNGFSCGKSSSQWDGHAVTCVGYNDDSSDPNQQYWIMLNSWGTTSGRPNGLFEIPMHNTFSCADSSGGYNTEWWTIPVTFTALAPTLPVAPVLVSPANGATVQSLTPTLAWNASSGATSYGVQLSTSATTFAPTVLNQSGLTVTQYAVTSGLSWNTLYYWRANAANAAGTSAWSAVWQFRTTAGPPPADPSNLTATAVSSSQINLSWQDNSSNETGFKIERKTGSGGTYAQIATVGANVTGYNSTLLSASTLYYYRVRAYNANGNSGYTNEAWATTLPPPPPVPVLVSPANGATGQSLTPTLAWNASSGAASYGVQLSTSPAFATTAVNQSGLSSTQYAIASGLSWNTLYYWRANATNTSGSTSAWSAAWVFVTAAGPPPAAPSNLTATVVSSSQINLSWQDNSNNETGFAIERKTGAGGTYAQIATVGANVTSYNSTTLSASTLYYYRVRAYNANGNSGYTNEAWATTLPPPPPVPVLVAPAVGSVISTLTPTLAWNASSGATSYGVQLSTSATFAPTVLNQSGLNATQYTVASGLSWNTLYYWRANATNTSGSTSAWSAAWVFVTAAGPPPAAP
jgi:transcriptional regulator CtsR